MNEPVISLRNVSKTYRAYAHPLHGLIARISGGRIGRYKEFHALNDVSFDIHKGETVGIIGRNGSGKSTLLQIICGIRQPTTGSVSVKGRISALLELGSGFQPEFTGRENVFLQGAIVGLSRGEMEARFDDIAAFADIGEYIDQPVKTYSSGMFVRLAFAVAISVDPDILVVDEALAVGDEAFQRKFFAYFRVFNERGGALLFVSHSTNTIVDMCDRAILMDSGNLLVNGSPKTAIGWYQKLLYSPVGNRQAVLSEIVQKHSVENPVEYSTDHLEPGAYFDPKLVSNSILRYECHGADIRQPYILNRDGKQVNVLVSGENYVFCYEAMFQERAENVIFGIMAKTLTGVELGGLTIKSPDIFEPGTVKQVRMDFRCSLLRGIYYFNAGVFGSVNGHATYLHRILDAVIFRVDISNDGLTGYLDLSPAGA